MNSFEIPYTMSMPLKSTLKEYLPMAKPLWAAVGGDYKWIAMNRFFATHKHSWNFWIQVSQQNFNLTPLSFIHTHYNIDL